MVASSRFSGVMYSPVYRLLFLISIFVLGTAQVRAESSVIEDFPQLDQRLIPGAMYRCGSITLGSWLIWLSQDESSVFQAFSPSPEIAAHPFLEASVEPDARMILAEFDALCGGQGAIQMLRLAEALIRYFHAHTDDSYQLQLAYYNLPDAALLQQLHDSGGRVSLLHGIYADSPSGLRRREGHFTNFLGITDASMVGSTHGQCYTFGLSSIPMEALAPGDRYQPKGGDSYIYMRCPEKTYPRFNYRSHSPRSRNEAVEVKIGEGPAFAGSEEVILLEGALVFWVRDA
ncbi:MAG: hypothetical protein EA353_05405 [Puniceicoccaceae bacterium]|nr:MAG: hypothetical protein EA353_05405 [Puniceicoccaceae bacterium]